MIATLYIPEKFPYELWLAVYDVTGEQLLHLAVGSSIGDRFTYYAMRGGWDPKTKAFRTDFGVDVRTLLDQITSILEAIQ